MKILIILNFLTTVVFAQELRIVPKTCNELLPDITEYIYFFEQVGDIWATQNKTKAKKIYDVLAIRTLYQERSKNYINPIDGMIKDAICVCYTENNSELFTSDSKIIRDCLDKNIKELIKNSKKEYKDLTTKLKQEEKTLKLTEKQIYEINYLKESSMKNMKKELK